MTEAPNICHWEEDPKDGFRFFLPCCCGGANSGPEGCTCDVPLSKSEQNWHDKFRAVEKELRLTSATLDWARTKLKENKLPMYPRVGEIRR